ncbi:MAG TPA: molybdopterin-binding protein, partial [Pseudonocardiaceae bacterium]
MSRETLTQEPDLPTREPGEPGPPRLSLLAAIIVGVLGIGSAVAIGEIIAVFVGPTSAPLLAVNEEIVNLTQARFKEFAVTTLGLGTNDKTVLMISVGVALLVFGVVAGVLSRRIAAPGVVLAIVLGVVGVYVVLQRQDLGQLGVLSPVGSLVGGVLVFRWLHRLALTAATHAGGEVVDRDAADESRRKFLVTSAGVAVGAGIVGLGGHALANRTNAQQSIDSVGALTPADPAPRLPAGADFAGSG